MFKNLLCSHEIECSVYENTGNTMAMNLPRCALLSTAAADTATYTDTKAALEWLFESLHISSKL